MASSTAPTATIRPNVASGAAASALTTLLLIAFGMFQGEHLSETQLTAITGALTVLFQGVVEYFAPADRKTLYGGIAGSVAVIISAGIAAVAGLPFDNTVLSSAVAAVIMTVVTGLVPNTLNEGSSTVQTPR
jgi:hypothetical protein